MPSHLNFTIYVPQSVHCSPSASLISGAQRNLESKKGFSQSEKCGLDNQALLERWRKLGFSEDAFWSAPDLVDFVFKSHLHRYITHPFYNHTISSQPRLIRREGQLVIVKEPHLLLKGRQTPWSEIRKKIYIDSDSRLYSKDAEGRKQRWTYLDEGLTPLNNDHFEYPQRFKKLDRAPERSQVQIVTTHAHQEDWCFFDGLLKGTRHSFLRIIPGEGFSDRHPNIHLLPKEVYSFGYGTQWHHFSFFSPLSTLQGKWHSPDDFEFLKQDQCVTPLDVTDEQVIKLMQIIQRLSKEESPFHFITANCCGNTAKVLNEAGIIDLKTKNHMAYLSYKFFIPKWMRKLINQITPVIFWVTPPIVHTAVKYVSAVIYSAVFAPLFTLLGAWRVNISYENEDNPLLKNKNLVITSNRIKALFSNIFDLFNPTKMEFDLTKNIYKWQKKQPKTYFERRV